MAQLPVAVIGGGWSGISAATHLLRVGVPVVMYESSPQLGGRARTVMRNGIEADNGQHLLVGAYHRTLNLIRLLGGDSTLYSRQPLRWRMYHQGKVALDIKGRRGQGPIGLLAALVAAAGFTMREKAALLTGAHRLQKLRGLPADMTADDLLRKLNQPARARILFWDPLCLAALNLTPAQASGALFLRVLQDSVLTADGADLIIPKPGLSRLVPDLFLAWTRGRPFSLHLGCPVTRVEPTGQGTWQVTDGSGMQGEYRKIVLATPLETSRRLLQRINPQCPVAMQLEFIPHAPITTVYFTAATMLDPETAMIGTTDPLLHWIFQHPMADGEVLIACVISGSGEHMEWSVEQLANTVVNRIKEQFQQCQPTGESWAIREKRATFLANPHTEPRRPQVSSVSEGIYLAGDFLATGYPATLEGAVFSGEQAAAAVLDDLPQTH